MRLILRMLKQTAVYWALDVPSTNDDGQPQWIYPVQIQCRWEDSTENRRADPTQEIEETGAVVYVNQDVNVGGVLLLGTLTSGMTNEAHLYGGKEIIKYEKNPTFKATQFVCKATLHR